MNHIDEYVRGINHDLESVIPKEGHPLVIDSIREQARRLGNIAQHNNDYLILMMDEFLTLIEDRYDVVKVGEYDTWRRIEHKDLMKDFDTYLKWGLDSWEHFDDSEQA